MDGLWTSNTFLLGCISVANHGSSVAVSLLTYQSGASIRICTKPLPGMRLGMKVDNSHYQKIKYLVIMFNHDSDLFWKNQRTALKPHWVSAGSFKKPAGSSKFLRCPELMILWFWIFQIPGFIKGYHKIKYLPHTAMYLLTTACCRKKNSLYLGINHQLT